MPRIVVDELGGFRVERDSPARVQSPEGAVFSELVDGGRERPMSTASGLPADCQLSAAHSGRFCRNLTQTAR